MTIKKLAFAAQQQLQSATGIAFKRSHIYEFLAACFGFKSYAAMGAEVVLMQHDVDREPPIRNAATIRRRCHELGYPSEAEAIVQKALEAFVTEQEISVIGLADLIAVLRDDEFIEPSPLLNDSLELLASQGVAQAHYALSLLYRPDDDGPQGSEYWYEQEKGGRVLSGAEKEWADAHAQSIRAMEKRLYHLRAAAGLGEPFALLDLAHEFDEPAFFDVVDQSEDIDPAMAADIAHRLGRPDDARKWMIAAAESGDINAMCNLLENCSESDLPQCWTWIYFARLLGTDLTEDEYFAIGEDGAPYDDEAGGPMYADGREGYQLPALSPEADEIARASAAKLFDRLPAGNLTDSVS